MDEPRLTRAGDTAVFVDLGDVSLDELHAAAASVLRLAPARAWTVGHSSLIGTFDATATTYQSFASAVREALAAARPAGDRLGQAHSIPVSFADADAPDLPLLLERAQLTRDAFLEAIGGLTLRARFVGFMRGFAYLEGLPASWQLPRRPTSRVRVPAGSFAMAGSMAAFYPADCPGGWNLIGRTTMPLWDVTRDRPNVIGAGDEVRIVAAGRSAERPRGAVASGISPVPPEAPPIATVRSAGQLTMVVGTRDERRREWGLPPGGPFDAPAAAAANRAVGNAEEATVLECAVVGPTIEVLEHAVLSWFGAEVSVRVGGRPVAEPRLFEAAPAEVVEIGPLRNGLRGVLAFRGGVRDPGGRFAAAPHALTSGDPLHRASTAPTERARLRALARDDRRVLRALAGPHPADAHLLDWIATSRWTVSPSLDRTGVRLHGSGRAPSLPTDLPSCGMQFGTVQCHPNGDLVVMGPDHPVTGGYLQPLTVVSADLWKLGQLAPGEEVRWTVIEVE